MSRDGSMRPALKPSRAAALLLAGALFVLTSAAVRSSDDVPPSSRPDAEPAAFEFFEKQVRPILATRCQGCHGPKKQKSGLRLDSRAAVLAGGKTGPAVVPGKPEESLLIEAIRYGDLFQMPPKSKLPDAEVATLTQWVAQGAPWPGNVASAHRETASLSKPAESKRHWSLQPLHDPQPPSIKNSAWPKTAIDAFIAQALHEHGLAPAPDADRRTWIRRATFDLIGLPPTPAEVEAFLADESPVAYERVVDRLLASPHYGERWGRHWLDLVRFAETSGHEFDYDIPGASGYRDYVIRALNSDLPFDRFVLEHIAGDLIEPPRRHPQEGFNESILATGFYFLGEGTHSPVDLRVEEARRYENQIDVLSKAFLGLTVACARCHDHKFDPITQRDYYALAGYFRSSRYQPAFIDPPERIGSIVAELVRLKAEMTSGIRDRRSRKPSASIAAYLKGAVEAIRTGKPEAELAKTRQLDPQRVGRWVEAMKDQRARDPDHPLWGWHKLIKAPHGGTAEEIRAAMESGRTPRSASTDSVLFEDFASNEFANWFISGQAFGSGPSRPGEWRPGDAFPVPQPHGLAHSGLVASRLQGVLRSRTFTIAQKWIHYRACGRKAQIRLVIDGFEKIRAPIYGELTINVNETGLPRWYAQDVSMWQGHDAYVEIADGAVVDFTSGSSKFVPGDGWIAVDEIRFSNEEAPPRKADHFAAELLGEGNLHSIDDLAQVYGDAFESALQDWISGRLTPCERDAQRAEIAGWLVDQGLIDAPATPPSPFARYQQASARIPEPRLALAIGDGTGLDARVLLRGNEKTPGDVAPRRFLEVLAGRNQPAPSRGSGRLELAKRMLDPAKPLLARVLVNRLWLHHFGQGLVRTPDDFGALGQPPSHPDLLDYLARQFVEGGWSIKPMHRMIVLSRTYRMQSTSSTEADQADPDNRWLHRFNVRRLEAEPIRDAMLAVSGRLDATLYGPSVPPHLTAFMDGRGKPATSGPLDGSGRRTIYLNIRRNFLNPMLLAFDFPIPSTTTGRRNRSNVPAQALTMLNDPFVLDQAHRWAQQLARQVNRSCDERVEQAFLEAFGRPPTEAERSQALAFLQAQQEAHGKSDDVAAWADLCHVLFNVKEFIFVN